MSEMQFSSSCSMCVRCLVFNFKVILCDMSPGTRYFGWLWIQWPNNLFE